MASRNAALLSFFLLAGAAFAETTLTWSRSGTSSQVHLQTFLRERARAHQQSMMRIMNGMSTAEAMQKLRLHDKNNDTLVTLVQQALQQQAGSRRLKSSGSVVGNLRATQDPTEKGYSGVDKAKNMINEMIQETQAKYDLEIQTCCDYDATQSSLIEQARQDISNFNAEAAEARKEVLDAQDHIEICEKKLPELKDALIIHNRECDMEAKSLRAQRAIIDEDLRVMNIILGMINCEKKDGSASLLTFANCRDECTGEAFVSFGHEQMNNLTNALQSDVTKQLMTDGMAESDGDEDADVDDQPSAPALPDLNATTTTTWGPPKLAERTLLRSGPCKTPVPEDKRTGKCSLDKNPNCERMYEKFLVIQTGIADKRDEVQGQLDALLLRCQLERTNIEAQIADFETQLQDQLVALAAATKKQNTAEEQSRLKSKELNELETDYAGMTDRCHTNYETFEGDECGLKKIRGELYKMKGQDHPAFFQDCVVSDWLPGECTFSCGGGQLKLTRTIVTAPIGGAACPVMEEVKSCSEQKCPIDCKLLDWGGWSSCTAKCGGGLMERGRDTQVEPAHGGEPCEETHEAKSCNLQSCDKDCELSDWTAWTDCTKACNSGSTQRVRTITSPSEGDGTCPLIRSAQRLQVQSCNVFQCKNDLLEFKFFKFTPTKLRNKRKANSVQISDIFLRNDEQVVTMKDFTASNPGGKSPGGEQPEKAVDEDPQTKWLDFNKKALIIERSAGPVKASHFRFVTANDATERDPVAWKMEGSADKKDWTLLHQTERSYPTPAGRYSPTEWFVFPTMPLRCASEVDVVLVLDGSGSLRSRGWKATKFAAEALVNSFMDSGKVQMAILLFSRKSEWIQHFSADKKETLKNVAGLKWPRGSTKTSEALNSANAEMSLGRADANSIVIVVTDGKPLSPKKTFAAAAKLRKSARLMWVPVTKYAPLAALKEMASYPKEDNLLALPTFEDLEKPSTFDSIISDVCPALY